jgi:glycosyltransferase involved in cell wall biosynthesis
MALGRPVVSTSVGCEGLNVQSGRHLLVANTPHEFAENIVRLLGDRVLSKKITEEARRLVVEQYDWDVVASQMLNVYSEVVQSSQISQI